MAWTFLSMQTEVIARGFSWLGDGGAQQTRLKAWLNSALHEVDDLERWDYRSASTTGASPLTISDLGEVDVVYDAARDEPLAPTTRGALLREFGDLTTTGVAEYFYITGGVITAFPVTTATLSVAYWKVGPDLSADGDTPLMPDRFRPAIVEGACARAYRDIDNPDMALVCQAEAQRIVDVMREQYELEPGGARVAVTFASDDW